MSQLKKGAILSYVTIFLTNIIGLVLTPFIIKSLGDAEYGLYILIGAFVGYMTVMDLGLNNTVVRYVSKYRAEGDLKGESNFLGITMLIYGVISTIILILGIFLYYNLENIFSNSLTDNEISKAKIMFLILIFNLVIKLPGGAFEAICNGYEHFVYPKKLRIVRYLVRSVAVVGLLYFGGDAIGLVVLDTLMNISIIGSNAYYVFKKLNVKFKIFSFDKKLIKQIFTYSFWIFLIGLVYQFQWKTGQFFLGIKTDTITVAIYAVGIILGSYYISFASAITGLLLPKAMKMIVNNADGNTITMMASQIGRVVLIVLLLILGGFIVFGKEFVVLWVGETYLNAWFIALIIMLTLTNNLVQSFLTSILKAKNLYRFKSVTYLLFISIGIILGYFLIDKYGEIGMILGICIGSLMSQIILNIYYIKKLDFNFIKFYKIVFIKILVCFAIILSLGLFFNNFFNDYNWFVLAAKILLFVICYAILFYIFVLNDYEKQLANNLKKNTPFFNKY